MATSKNLIMKKLIFLSTMLIFININAQDFARQSLEMGVGQNLYHDGLGNSRSSILVNAGYRYMITPKFGLQGNWQFDVLRSKDHPDHPECEYRAYSQGFRVEMFRRIARFGRFTVNGTAGFGGTYYWLRDNKKERVFNYTAAGNVLYSLGQKRNPWGFVGLEYRGTANTAQEKTLNSNFETTGNPIQAFKQDLVFRVGVYLDNKKDKPHADWYEEDDCIECIQNPLSSKSSLTRESNIQPSEKELVIPHEVVLFDEGSYEIREDQKNPIVKMVDFMDKHPDLKIELVGAACGGKGSPQRNFELSELRAKAVYEKMASLRGDDYSRLSYRGTGVDTKYRHQDQDIQKRVNFIIYK